MTPWDVTKSAESHAAFAGVLAGIALALLVLLYSTSSSDRVPRSRRKGGWTLTPILAPIALGAVLLALSAMLWGELSGYPEAEEIAVNLEIQKSHNVAAASAAAEMLIGTASTLLSALGAILVLFTLLKAVAPQGRKSESSHLRLMQGAFGFIAALAAFEVVEFVLVSSELTAQRSIMSPNLAGLVAGIAVFVINWGHGRDRPKKYAQGWRRMRVTDGSPQRLAVYSAATALLGYALVPVHIFGRAAPEIGAGHVVALILIVTSSILFLAFTAAAGYLFLHGDSWDGGDRDLYTR